jgi:hypothetical protein
MGIGVVVEKTLLVESGEEVGSSRGGGLLIPKYFYWERVVIQVLSAVWGGACS